MQTRSTRSSVLGKRHAPAESSSPTACDANCSQALPTPEQTPNPKRVKIAASPAEGDSNKENIPPFKGERISTSPTVARPTRSLRRTSTDLSVSGHARTSTPRRHSSMSGATFGPSTPATALSHLSLATPPPTPPSTLLPICARARALLRATCNGTAGIAGRVDERATISEFITSFLRSKHGDETPHSTLYISGLPGTGKTALVDAVLRTLQEDLQESDAKVLTVNCMALSNCEALWTRLEEELNEVHIPTKKRGRGRQMKDTPWQRVQTLFAQSPSKTILVLDELDHIASSTDALTSLFSLASNHSSHVRIIGIANTHTLTSSSSTTSSIQSLAGVKTLHFAPYAPPQLLEILMARLAPLFEVNAEVPEKGHEFLPLPTLTLLTKKIASQTGDVRAVFEVLRGAIDIAVMSPSASNPLEAPTPPVTPSHILAALKAYAPASTSTRLASSQGTTTGISTRTSDSEIVSKVRNLGLQARLVLLSMLLARKRLEAGLSVSGSPATSPSVTSSPRSPTKRAQLSGFVASSGGAGIMDTTQVYAYYTAILTRSEKDVFTPVSRSEFGDLVGVLETIGLVMSSAAFSGQPGTPCKSGRRGLGRSASFNVGASRSQRQDVRFVEGLRLEEVARGLGIASPDAQPGDGVDVREEEVKSIWEKERVKISREAKARAGAGGPGDIFDEATED